MHEKDEILNLTTKCSAPLPYGRIAQGALFFIRFSQKKKIGFNAVKCRLNLKNLIVCIPHVFKRMIINEII